jgi:hypothetical protein
MKSLIPAVVVGLLVVALHKVESSMQAPTRTTTAEDVAAVTYEHLASAIIEIEATEDNLVKSILIGHHQAAQRHLRQASNDAARRQNHLEEAATEITNIANEGDKRVQAVRQRLKKAGHTHNTDEVTKEDFMFIDSKEKKQLLDLGRKVARLGAGASAEDIRGVHDELTELFTKSIAEQ